VADDDDDDDDDADGAEAALESAIPTRGEEKDVTRHITRTRQSLLDCSSL
jgi:hypothetical protein